MRYYQCSWEDEMSDFTLEIINQCGFPGFYIWKTLWAIMTKACTPWDPGCAKYFKESFYLQFPKIKDHRTIKKTLGFLAKSKKLFYFEENDHIYLWLFELEEKADEWCRRNKKTNEEKNKKRPQNAGELKRKMEEKMVFINLEKIHEKHTPLHETPKPMHEKQHETPKPMQRQALKTKELDKDRSGVTRESNSGVVSSLKDNKQYTDKHTVMREGKTKEEKRDRKTGENFLKPPKKKPKKKTGLEKLHNADLEAMFKKNKSPAAKEELLSRGIRIASFDTSEKMKHGRKKEVKK